MNVTGVSDADARRECDRLARSTVPQIFAERVAEAPVCLSETHTRTYWWCSPPRIGTANVRPTVWTARGIGASLYSDKCVRASL